MEPIPNTPAALAARVERRAGQNAGRMDTDESRTQHESRSKGPGRGAWRRFGLVLALVAVSAVLVAARPQAISIDYVLTLLRQVAINGILAVGVTYVLLTGGVDLSLGSVVALTGVVAATFAHPGAYPLALPLGMGLLTGALCGTVNGLVVTRGR
ncbi:MAG TPA: hypothetical protein PLF51_17255, partial [Candidatus Hydrogenedentes bacterium]|nr:hypothetical protein [Candidatus Hydrogenedentota bacterium]